MNVVIRKCHYDGPRCDDVQCPTLVCQLCTLELEVAYRVRDNWQAYSAQVYNHDELPVGIKQSSLDYVQKELQRLTGTKPTPAPVAHLPFELKRIGPRGPDSPKHLFCVEAHGNPELIRTGECADSTLINGALGSDPQGTRKAIQGLCDALNAVWADYLLGKFHE